MERLQKVIASSGYCSRRKAEELIVQGKVKVNNVVITELGVKVSPTDTVTIDGKALTKEEYEYILLYKPRGYLTTTSDDKDRKTVMDLIETSKRLYPVGRLDYDTSGLLLLTNDGNLTNLLIHPRNNIDKMYVAKIEGILTPIEIKKLENGVMIDDYKTSKSRVKVKKIDKKNNTSLVYITIHEGKNHQVKRMFEAVGHDVIKLKRETLAFLDLSGLKSGEYRYLSLKEVKKLYSLK